MYLLHRDGRLQEHDQILAIDGQVLDANISHQQAITILQRASGRVELVLARGHVPLSTAVVPDPAAAAAAADHVPQPADDHLQPPAAGASDQQSSDMVVSALI